MYYKVSIIVPVFNVDKYIDDCVKSILNQSYSNIEIILVDDGSSDSSGMKCDGWAKKDSRISVIHQPNKGVVSARYEGIINSTGEYLLFVDGDDYIESDMVEYMLSHIGDADIISTGVYWEKNNDQIVKRYDKFKEGEYSGKNRTKEIISRMIYDSNDDLLHPLTSWIWNKMYRRELCIDVYKDMDFTIKFAEDSAFLYIYILKCNSIVISHKYLYHYRYREDSVVHKVNYGMLEDISRFYNLLRPVFLKGDTSLELMFQLEKWVASRIVLCINEFMNFDNRAKIPSFMFVPDMFAGKSVVLYGAGKVGKDYYNQLKKMNVDIVAWADKNYIKLQEKGLEVISPNTLKDFNYDILLICVEDENIKNDILLELDSIGVDKSKIFWQRPFKVV